MRLIDADKLIEVLNKKSVPFNANVNDAILTAPTVDAVEVVRCKDCKYRDKCHKNISIREYDKDIECNYAKFEKLTYCSFGERKKNVD